MSMVKTTPVEGWDGLTHGQPSASIIKMASGGLRGGDLNAFMKRASHCFMDQIGKIDIKPDEVPVHWIALGSHEVFGPNKNGDSFKRATCVEHHPTFTKYARVYREHFKNRDPAYSYGIVKASAFNEAMDRIELIVALNASKSAADRNGGQVADKELEKLARDQDLGASMSCLVEHDVCSSCGNRARNRSEYCLGEHEGGHCKHGGCRHNLGTVAEDGHLLHVDNPFPVWFDISHVENPASHTAYGNRADYLLSKSAGELLSEYANQQPVLEAVFESATGGISSKWPENSPPARRAKLAAICAMWEGSLAQAALMHEPASVVGACGLAQEKLASLMALPPVSRQAALEKLASRGIILTFQDWARLQDVPESKIKMAATHMPQCFRRLQWEMSLRGGVPVELEYVVKSASIGVPEIPITLDWYSEYSLDAGQLRFRAARAALRGEPHSFAKSGNAASENCRLSSQYAAYKLAALDEFSSCNPDFQLTVRAAVLQNCV